MQYLAILTTVIGSIFLEVVKATNYIWYSVYFFPNATITKLQVTSVTPAETDNATWSSNDAILYWPGLVTTMENNVLPNVVNNQPEGAGSWVFYPEYWGSPSVNLFLAPGLGSVYPGDEVTTIFALERSTGNWSDTWSLTPGGIERGAGAVPFGGGVIFDHSVDPPNDQAFNLVQISIEIQNAGTWGFGSLVWKNIIVAAETTDSSWCNNSYISTVYIPQSAPMAWNMTPATPFTIGNVTTCYVAEMIFQNPMYADTSATATSATPTPSSISGLSASSSSISFSASSAATTFKTRGSSEPKKSQSKNISGELDIMKGLWNELLAVVVGLL